MDIDLKGNSELGVNEFERLQMRLDERFIKNLPERPVHPSNLLTTSNSMFHMKDKSLLFPLKQLIKSAMMGKLLIGDPRVGVFLGIYSTVLMKRQ